MKRFLLVGLLTLLPTFAQAQCNGIVVTGTVCGNATGTNNTMRPTTATALGYVPGGSNGQIQYNNSGAFGGFTASGDAQINTSTGAVTIQPNAITTGKLLDANVTNAKLATGAANTVKGSLNGTTTSDLAVASCSALYSITKWTTGSGWSCGINPVLPSRAVAATLDLTAFTAVQTQGYATAGDGGSATFVKTASALIDSYIATGLINAAGSGCTNGSYIGVAMQGGTGRGAIASIDVAGNVVVGVTITTPGNGYTVGDQLTQDTAKFTCGGNAFNWQISTVGAATGSFTDTAGNKWQLIADGQELNIKQFGAACNWNFTAGDAGSTNDTTAVQNALNFAANILPPTIDAYGQAGTILEVPNCISLVSAITVWQGTWLRGKGRYSSGLKMSNGLSNASHWITVCDSLSQIPCFGTQLTDLSLWHHGGPSANAGTAMIFTNSLQQARAFARLHLPSGSRACFSLQTGYGGASMIGFEDIECGTNTTTNPGMFINYPSAIVMMKGINIETGVAGLAQSGMSVTGGHLNVEALHCESYVNCIFMNVPVNSGNSRFHQVTGGGTGCTNAIIRQGGSADNVNIVGLISGVCTNAINDGGVTTANPVIADAVL